MLRTYPKLRKGEERLSWILHKVMEILCLAANISQCNIAFSIVHVQLCFKSFLFYVDFLPSRFVRIEK